MNIDKVRAMQEVDSDLSDHYETIYLETLAQRPRLIVELGVCHSENSARIFSLVNEEIGSWVIGVDIVRYPYDFVYNGMFVCGDDVAFAERFKKTVRQPVDVLFIDSSHVYEHTCNEIEAWFPLLAPNALVMFHDTNLRTAYTRKNGSHGVGWDNERGVIRAIEDFVGESLDETEELHKSFCVGEDCWTLRHWPLCNGFTCLKRTPPAT